MPHTTSIKHTVRSTAYKRYIVWKSNRNIRLSHDGGDDDGDDGGGGDDGNGVDDGDDGGDVDGRVVEQKGRNEIRDLEK